MDCQATMAVKLCNDLFGDRTTWQIIQRRFFFVLHYCSALRTLVHEQNLSLLFCFVNTFCNLSVLVEIPPACGARHERSMTQTCDRHFTPRFNGENHSRWRPNSNIENVFTPIVACGRFIHFVGLSGKRGSGRQPPRPLACRACIHKKF